MAYESESDSDEETEPEEGSDCSEGASTKAKGDRCERSASEESSVSAAESELQRRAAQFTGVPLIACDQQAPLVLLLAPIENCIILFHPCFN